MWTPATHFGSSSSLPSAGEAVVLPSTGSSSEPTGRALPERSQGLALESWLERRREALEGGVGGDSDCAYRFSLPRNAAEIRAWVALLARVQLGDLHAEAAAVVDSCASA